MEVIGAFAGVSLDHRESFAGAQVCFGWRGGQMSYADSLLINLKAIRLFFAQHDVLQVADFSRIAKQVHELFRNQTQPIADLQRLTGETTQD